MTTSHPEEPDDATSAERGDADDLSGGRFLTSDPSPTSASSDATQSPSDAVDPQASVRDASPWAAPSTDAEPQAGEGLADEGLADDDDAPGRVEPSQEEGPAPDPIAPPAYLPPLPAYRPVGADDETRSYTPPPELRAGWQRTSWDSPVSPTPEVWFEPVPVSAPLPEPRIAPRGRGAGLPTVLGASLLAAILASSGTLLALSASGALEPSTAPPTSPVATAAAFSSPVAGSSEAPAPVPAARDQTAAVIAAATNVSPAVVTIDAVAGATRTTRSRTPEGVGSGVIFDPTGWILTNHHVVQGSDQLTVTLKDDRQFKGTVYGVDTLTDLAIVKIDASGLPTATIGDSSTIQVGQLAIAIGSPLATYTNTVTSGIVSALGRHDHRPGRHADQQPHPDRRRDQPGQQRRTAARRARLRHRHQYRRRRVGAGDRLRDPDQHRPADHAAGSRRPDARPAVDRRPLRRRRHGRSRPTADLPVDHGAWVHSGADASGQSTPAVVAGGPADTAGVRDNDIIVSIEGITIDKEHPLDDVLSQYAPGKTVTLGVLRERPGDPAAADARDRPANL